MTPKESVKLIAAAGGDHAFATLLGIARGKYRQRVNNWKRRGIPADVFVQHYELIQRLRAEPAKRRTS